MKSLDIIDIHQAEFKIRKENILTFRMLVTFILSRLLGFICWIENSMNVQQVEASQLVVLIYLFIWLSTRNPQRVHAWTAPATDYVVHAVLNIGARLPPSQSQVNYVPNLEFHWLPLPNCKCRYENLHCCHEHFLKFLTSSINFITFCSVLHIVIGQQKYSTNYKNSKLGKLKENRQSALKAIFL